MLDEKYDTAVFTDPTIKGQLNKNAVKTKKHLYDHVVYDSANEKAFAMELDTSKDVAVYVKLPSGFYISTPVENTIPTGRSRFMRAISSIFILWQRSRGL